MRQLLIIIGCSLLCSAAFAAGTPANNVMPGDAGSQPAGGLTAADVSGKWILDANGKEIGRVAGVTPDGASAKVRTDDGRNIQVPMRRLGLGNGPNTVIEEGGSEADRLNHIEAGVGTPVH